jgi:hypothetical protein
MCQPIMMNHSSDYICNNAVKTEELRQMQKICPTLSNNKNNGIVILPNLFLPMNLQRTTMQDKPALKSHRVKILLENAV